MTTQNNVSWNDLFYIFIQPKPFEDARIAFYHCTLKCEFENLLSEGYCTKTQQLTADPIDVCTTLQSSSIILFMKLL